MTTVTKKMLASTLKNLMEEKSLSKITINDLTQACGVSRQTFYNNFKDIYDLVEWIYQKDTEIFLGKDVTYDNWQESLRSIFQYIEDNRSFVLNTYHALGKEHIEKLLYQEVDRFLTTLIFPQVQDASDQLPLFEFAISFYTYSLVGVGLDWIDKRMPESAQDLVQKIERVMIGAIVDHLRANKSGKVEDK